MSFTLGLSTDQDNLPSSGRLFSTHAVNKSNQILTKTKQKKKNGGF
jgi:hypothetical protein